MIHKNYLIDPTTFHISSYQEFEPIMYGEGKGFEADLLRAIARLWDVKVQFHPQKIYANIWESPEKNKYDIAAGGITPQKDRKEHAIFSTPTVNYSQSLLVRKIDYITKTIIGYDSFKNTVKHKIGVVKDSAGEKFGKIRARECGIKENIFVYYTSESELIPALLTNKIDAYERCIHDSCIKSNTYISFTV